MLENIRSDARRRVAELPREIAVRISFLICCLLVTSRGKNRTSPVLRRRRLRTRGIDGWARQRRRKKSQVVNSITSAVQGFFSRSSITSVTELSNRNNMIIRWRGSPRRTHGLGTSQGEEKKKKKKGSRHRKIPAEGVVCLVE
ncbi:hypothetical protein PUN28_008553 [Cardiocondyla obscurior]|uniref:Uncharacterized protein n=1 Tax=Cardiocondyla obscurior TaxID=286306 RepID=A0AAW2FZT2_9HYME